jgi:hypothetical protein
MCNSQGPVMTPWINHVRTAHDYADIRDTPEGIRATEEHTKAINASDFWLRETLEAHKSTDGVLRGRGLERYNAIEREEFADDGPRRNADRALASVLERIARDYGYNMTPGYATCSWCGVTAVDLCPEH